MYTGILFIVKKYSNSTLAIPTQLDITGYVLIVLKHTWVLVTDF